MIHEARFRYLNCQSVQHSGSSESRSSITMQTSAETGSRHRNLSLIDTDDSERMRDLLSARLSPAYRSVRCSLMRKVSGRSNRSKGKKDPEVLPQEDDREIYAGESPPANDSFYFENPNASRDAVINNKRITSALSSMLDAAELKLLRDMEKGILEIGPDGSLFPKSSKNFLNISYIWGCFHGLVDLLPRLEESGVDIHYAEPTTGINAILAASFADRLSCVEHLLRRGADVNTMNAVSTTGMNVILDCSLEDRLSRVKYCLRRGADISFTDVANHYTPLHFAAFGNACSTAKFLLDHGAELNVHYDSVEPILHCAVRGRSFDMVKLLIERGGNVGVRNHLGQTPLHVACLIRSTPCVRLLLNAPGIDINAVDCSKRTPLHSAVISNDSSADLVEILANRGAMVNTSDNEGYTPLHIAALNELSQCADILIWAGADLSAPTSRGVSALKLILNKCPESLKVFRQRLDASIRLIRPGSHNREFEMRLNFDLLFPSHDKCETSFINTFLQERQKDLLSHPLAMAFLHLKWEKIRKFYLLRILIYLLTVIFMTTYVLTALAYKCYNSGEPGATEEKLCEDNHAMWFFFRKHVIEVEWYLLLVLTCLTIPRKIFGFVVHKSLKQYLSNIDNVLDIVVLVGVLITSSVYTGRTYEWQNYVGAFSILCAWTNLMLMVGQLPSFGTYVAMFTQIQSEFAKLLLAYSGLLIGFTISFCVVFPREPSFANPFTGLIKVLAMMAGELDFEGLLEHGHPHDPMLILSICSQILFTLFLVFVTVILMNLLVGIAVHDIQGLRRQAGLTKLVRQTKLILFIEMAMYKGIMPRVFRKLVRNCELASQDRKPVLVVKPLNPLEERLPKDVLKAAYDIAQRNKSLMSEESLSLSEHVAWMKQQSGESEIAELRSTVQSLSARLEDHEDGMRFMKEELKETNRILERILATMKGNDKS